MASPDSKQPKLGSRFEEALQWAARLHSLQRRKGTDVPYVAHLMSVASLVLEDGGGEDEAIAGLLHDAVEDQGGMETLEEIRRRFGDRVATIVEGCTDSALTPKPPWRGRKEAYIASVRTASPEILRVMASDKVHNARSILEDYRCHGESVWDRFKGGREGTLWYYRSLVTAFRGNGESRLVQELDRIVSEIERLAAVPR